MADYLKYLTRRLGQTRDASAGALIWILTPYGAPVSDPAPPRHLADAGSETGAPEGVKCLA